MFSWVRGIVFALVIKCATSAYTQDYCKNIQFNFNNVPGALADFKACSDLEPRKHPTELTHRFATSWAKFAVERGLGEALQVLSNKEVRRILVPSEDWHGIVSRYTSASCEGDGEQTTRNIQFLIIAILVLQIMVLVYLVRTASVVADGLTLNMCR